MREGMDCARVYWGDRPKPVSRAIQEASYRGSEGYAYAYSKSKLKNDKTLIESADWCMRFTHWCHF